MRTYDVTDKDGQVFAFEIDNTWITRWGVIRVAQSIPGVTIIRGLGQESWREALSWWVRDEHFCEFELQGTRFVAWEPWGDSSRYWIGPEPPRFTDEVAVVKGAFAAARVPSVAHVRVLALGCFAAGLVIALSSWVAGSRGRLMWAGIAALGVGVAILAIVSRKGDR